MWDKLPSTHSPLAPTADESLKPCRGTCPDVLVYSAWHGSLLSGSILLHFESEHKMDPRGQAEPEGSAVTRAAFNISLGPVICFCGLRYGCSHCKVDAP